MIVWLSNANGRSWRRLQASQLTCQLVNVWPPRKSPMSPATQTLVVESDVLVLEYEHQDSSPAATCAWILLTCNPRTADPDMSVAALGAPVIVAVAIVLGQLFVAAARICLQLIMDQESDRGSD